MEHHHRTFENGLVVCIAQNRGRGRLLGGDTWTSAYFLQRYLAAHRELVAGKKVLELGSGTGYLAMSAHLLGASLSVATDRGDVLALAHANLKENGALLRGANSSGRMECLRCDWLEVQQTGALPDELLPRPSDKVPSDGGAGGAAADSAAGGGIAGSAAAAATAQPAANSGGPFDLILISDCIYQDQHAAALLAVLKLLLEQRCAAAATAPAPVAGTRTVLMCQSFRGAMDVEAAFFEAATREGIQSTLISQDEATHDRKELKSKNVAIWRLWREPDGTSERAWS